MGAWDSFCKFIDEFYACKYRSALAKEADNLDDFFMIITFSEMFGIENPLSFYLLDIMPELAPRFHLWHTKMGLPHSPFDNMPCTCC